MKISVKQQIVFIFLTWALCIPSISFAEDVKKSREEEWNPEQPIVITVPSNPGGGWDQLGRFLQRTIVQEHFAQVPVEVVNKGGAGGIIALAELVSSFQSNPHRLMITGFGMMGATIMHNSEFSLSSTTPIARLTSEYQAIGVPYDSPYKTLNELLEAFKAEPQTIVWGGGSAGGADNLFVNLLANRLGIDSQDINYVAFTGGGEATAALMGGQVTVGVSGYSEWTGVVEANRVLLLGVSSPERIVNDHLTTFTEIGVDVVFQNWRGIVAPPDISEQEKQYLISLVTAARNSETWQNIVKRNQWQESFLAGQAFEAFIVENRKQTHRIIEHAGLGANGEGYALIGPYFFPLIAGVGLLLCSLTLCGRWIYRNYSRLPADPELNGPASLRQFYYASLSISLYIVGLAMLGFIYVTPFFIAIISKIFGSNALKRDVAVGIVLTALVYVIFVKLLNVTIP